MHGHVITMSLLTMNESMCVLCVGILNVCCNVVPSHCVHRGVWNAPYISGAVLFKGEWLAGHFPNFHSDYFDPDMAWCEWMRDQVNPYHCE